MMYSKILLLCLFLTFCQSVKTICKNDICNNDIEILNKYEPSWDSLDKRPLPQWYDDYKIGIFIHWGVYSVPAFGSEWFWINWKTDNEDNKYEKFMKNTYKPGFAYQDFASDFTAELFNATQWSLMLENSGAKYVVLTSKHHDGYSLWPSSKSFSWNSVDVGPHIDIVGELSTAIRNNTSLKFGLYYSLFEWFNRLYVQDKENSFKTQTYVKDKVLPELREIIHAYKPEIIWADGDWEAEPEYWNSTEFISWLYNESPVRETVVTNDRWGSGALCKHGDIYTCQDRFNPGVLNKHKWENCFTLDKTSWGNRFDTNLDDYMTSEELIREIVTTVSCNGNVLINVGPTKFGTIPIIFQERLRDMGEWLKINGEAIYSTKYWTHQKDLKGVWYTQKQSTNGRTNVYAIILNYPYDTNKIELFAINDRIDSQTEIQLLGMETESITWYTRKSFVEITMPPKNLIDKKGLKFAWTFRINLPS